MAYAWTTPMSASVGQLYTAALYNANTRDNLNNLRRIALRKSADESVISSTALQNDDELLFAIAASEVWTFRFDLLTTGGATGGFRVAVTVPASCTLDAAASQAGGTGSGTTTTGGAAMDLGNGASLIIVTGSVFNSTNAGNVTLQWAQSTSNGTASKILRGSTLVAQRIS